MSSYVLGPGLSREAAEAISEGQLIYVNTDGKWAVCSTTTPAAEAVATDNVESGAWVAGRLLSDGGTFKLIAGVAVATIGLDLFQAASGRVSTVAGGAYICKSVATASGAASHLEVLVACAAASRSRTFVREFTADGALTQSMSGFVITNLGATGVVTLTLPAGSPAGTTYTIGVSAAFELRIDPPSDKSLIQGGSVRTAGKYISADDEGETIVLTCNSAGNWLVTSTVGTWTVEA